MVVTSIVHLQKTNNFPKFDRCGSKIMSATPSWSSKYFLAGNPFWVKLETPNLVKTWKIMSTLIGENLVLISQTTSELFKIKQNSLSTVGHFRHSDVQNDQLVVYSDQWILVDFELLKSRDDNRFLNNQLINRLI